MNENTTNTTSEGAPDVGRLQDNELEVVAGGIPFPPLGISTSLGNMVSSAIGQAVSQQAGSL